MDVKIFKKQPIMGILRGVTIDEITPLIEALCAAGLQTVEITMNTPRALEIIRKAVDVSAGRITVGAGTVVNMDLLQDALGTGASFIVMPTLELNVMEYCTKHDIAVFPGAFTPQEVLNAWRSGATMVKLFPAKFFGPDYVRELKGPLNDVELLACGGVTPENMGEYFQAGAAAVAIGGSVFGRELLDKKDFSGIIDRVKKYIDLIPAVKE